jgi:hypothetical protein
MGKKDYERLGMQADTMAVYVLAEGGGGGVLKPLRLIAMSMSMVFFQSSLVFTPPSEELSVNYAKMCQF